MARKDWKMEWVLTRIAWKSGTSKKQVRKEIEEAIQDAYMRTHASGDPKALALWSEIPRESEIPTADELIRWLANKTRQRDLVGLSTDQLKR